MLIHPIQISERYPIGSVIEAYYPPSDDWMLCNGQVLAQADYPALYVLMDNPHPIFQHWEPRYAGYGDSGISQVVYDGSQWVACGYGSMAYSSDGDSWTEVALATYTNIFTGIAYDGTTFVSIADGSSPIGNYVTSTDGQNWTERLLPTNIEGHAVCHDGTYFYLVSYDDGPCLYSADGTSWSAGTTMPDTTFYGCAASPDVLVATSNSSVLAVSTDSMTTWKYYSTPFGNPNEIYYDPTDDIFVVGFDYYSVYGVSPGDDGVNWDIRTLPVSPVGNVRSYKYGYSTFNRIKKAGNYWFALSQYASQMAFSSDLVTWNTFPIMYNEWYDIIYNSTSGYYYLLGYGNYSQRWKEVDEYNTGTHFKLPFAKDQYDFHSMTKKRKYIRVQ